MLALFVAQKGATLTGLSFTLLACSLPALNLLAMFQVQHNPLVLLVTLETG